MVANCANPNCNRKFRQLSKGRLFLLPPLDGPADLMWSVQRLSDHCYWLCPECAQTHTISRQGSTIAVSRREPSVHSSAKPHPNAT